MRTFGVRLTPFGNSREPTAYLLDQGRYLVSETGKGGDDAFELLRNDQGIWISVCSRATFKCAVAKYKLINYLPPYDTEMQTLI